MTEKSSAAETAVYFPPTLLNAVVVSFDEHIDGYLLDARPRDGGYRAAIFFDASGRHGNGDTLNTGQVVQVSERQGYHLITTVYGQRYVIVSYMMVLVDETAEGEQFQIVSLTNTGGHGPRGSC